MAKYRDIAESIRASILAGEYPVGSRLPGIPTLQAHYQVPAMNTIRSAVAILVEEGMLEIRQGVGTFVVRATPVHQLDIPTTLTEARDSLTTVIAALTTSSHTIAFDLATEDIDTASILSAALRQMQNQQQNRAANAPDDAGRDEALRSVAIIESLAERVETAWQRALDAGVLARASRDHAPATTLSRETAAPDR